jgi:hypothetical protein
VSASTLSVEEPEWIDPGDLLRHASLLLYGAFPRNSQPKCDGSSRRDVPVSLKGKV